ncbi:MAG: hydantoinase B/oxoprolinase family protein [Alphaproteobacteria bacterium]|nr:hydantoinase B/oxoprolinase family protein [Alphaproteobacteria bacterium]
MDPVRTEVMKNRLSSIVEEAAVVAYRTAHTTFVKQTQDFRVSLATLDGEFFACPIQTGVTSGVGHTVRPMVDAIGMARLEPGDVIISNDPFSTGGLVTHSMDIHMVRPIFRDGTLLCFAWSFIHASDIGGAVPGSISPSNTEIFQEGFRLRPMKLYRRGEVHRELVEMLMDNSRIGEEIWGDLSAMIAAMKLLDRRIQELCDRVGVDVFKESVKDVMDYAEMKARGVIASLKDGVYTFSDYLEGMAPGEVVYLQGKLTIRGDEAEVDFSGSDPQAQASFNFVTTGKSHPFLALALTNYMQTVEPTIPINGGMQRPIRTHAPLGTVMNAAFPAAMGNRWVAVMRVYDVVLGCLAQAIPGGLVACGAGQAGIIAAAWQDPATAKRRVSVVEPFCGGSGGRTVKDGVDATDAMIGYLKSTPIEAVEAEVPLVVRRHALESDSFGHGRHRGGAAICIELENRAVELTITVRGLDRFRFQPWGAQGGSCGRNGTTWLNPESKNAREELGRIRVLTMKQGDVLRMNSPSGGGFGDPLKRDPAAVLRDVLDELLSAALARSAYGVVIRDGRVDEAATRAERARMAATARATAAFAFGPEREAHERRWPNAASAALADAVLAAPAGLRPYLLATAKQRLNAGTATIDPAAVRHAVADLLRPLTAAAE